MPASIATECPRRKSQCLEMRLRQQNDAKSCPHLPHYGESTANVLRGRFGSVDRCCTRLGADSETQGKTCNQKVIPGVSSSHPDASHEGYETGDEYRASSTEELVERHIGPAANQCRAEVGRAVEKSTPPYFLFADIESSKVKLLGAVHSCLVHALNDSRASTEYHQEVQYERLSPAVIHFILQPALLFC